MPSNHPCIFTLMIYDHLDELEAEAMYIIREVYAQF